jgi:hypothetical protein
MIQSQLTAYEKVAAELTVKLVEAEKVIGKIKKGVTESELVWRKPYNTVPGLKGNVRIFCRVQPILQTTIRSNIFN